MKDWAPPIVDPQDEPRFACLSCADTGWEMFWCHGERSGRTWERPRGYTELASRPCGRVKAHSGHTFVERCQCWLTNTVILERRAREATKRAEKVGA